MVATGMDGCPGVEAIENPLLVKRALSTLRAV